MEKRTSRTAGKNGGQDEAISERPDRRGIGSDGRLAAKASSAGATSEADLREVINALRYLVRSGCGWRMLPKDFPAWQTVHWWFRRLMRRFLFRTLHDIVLMLDRELEGRQRLPQRWCRGQPVGEGAISGSTQL